MYHLITSLHVLLYYDVFTFKILLFEFQFDEDDIVNGYEEVLLIWDFEVDTVLS